MAQEIELKLGVAPAAIGKVTELPWLRETLKGPVKREKLISVYFDTPKQKLHRNGIALRVAISARSAHTIKVIQKGGRGAFARDEWEEEIGGR